MTREGRLFTVLGGTGFLGQRIAGELLRRGHRVRIAARHPYRQRRLAHHTGAEPVKADLFEPATLAAALDGAEGAVNATSLYREKGDLSFTAVHVDAARRVAALAQEHGLSRLIQISGVGADPNAGNDYIRARGAGEDAVRDALPGATIVRPTVMFGKNDTFLSAILTTGRRSPVFPLFGRGQTRLQPVLVDDVACAIAAILTGDGPAPLYEFGGPRVLSYRDLVAEVLTVEGLERVRVPMPFPAWQAIASMAEHLPGTPLTQTQVALMRHDNVAEHGLPGLEDLGVSPTDIVEFLRRRG